MTYKNIYKQFFLFSFIVFYKFKFPQFYKKKISWNSGLEQLKKLDLSNLRNSRDIPGPGHYEIKSIFDRHTIK